jgi:hypothetical protein
VGLCECGCGQEVKPGDRFIYNHHRKGKEFTAEHRANLRRAMSGKNNGMYGRNGPDYPCYGRKHTPEQIEKNRQAHLGENNVGL